MGKKRVIVWRITQDCNMKCKFCSYSTEVERKRDNAKLEEVGRLSEILGQYKKNTGTPLLISWIGGEPLLWEPLFKISKQLHKKYGVDISTTTNGILLSSSETRKNILECFSEIVISLDGFEENNDAVRQFHGHFKLVSENIKSLVIEKRRMESKTIIKVNTILMKRNIEEFEEFCSYLAKLGVDEITFNQLGGYDRPEFYEDNRLQKNQVEQLIAKLTSIRTQLEKVNFTIHGSDSYLERILWTTEDKKNPIQECNPASWFWFINENGYISPCSYTSYEYKYNTEEIKTWRDVDAIEGYFRKLREAKLSKWCKDCYCTQVYNKFK